jgi:hypothetical protein
MDGKRGGRKRARDQQSLHGKPPSGTIEEQEIRHREARDPGETARRRRPGCMRAESFASSVMARQQGRILTNDTPARPIGSGRAELIDPPCRQNTAYCATPVRRG